MWHKMPGCHNATFYCCGKLNPAEKLFSPILQKKWGQGLFSIRGVPFMFAAVGKTYTNALAMFPQFTWHIFKFGWNEIILNMKMNHENRIRSILTVSNMQSINLTVVTRWFLSCVVISKIRIGALSDQQPFRGGNVDGGETENYYVENDKMN